MTLRESADRFLGRIKLMSGSHDGKSGNLCAMEAASYLAGEPHSDHPECVSPVIASYMRGWNDGMRSDAERELLKPWVVKVLHTKTTPEDEETRAFLALDWLVRVHTPAWLDLAGLTDHGANLRNLPALTSTEICLAVQQTVSAARDAAWDAARDAAWDAAGDATWAAAGDAAGAAAWAAARDAARDAAGKQLESTVQMLQASAFDLLERMIAVGIPREADVKQRESVS
jgi:hypothetical protein